MKINTNGLFRTLLLAAASIVALGSCSGGGGGDSSVHIEPVTFSIESGRIPQNQTVKLSTETEDAEIGWSYNEFTESDWDEVNLSAKPEITITDDCTVYAVAYIGSNHSVITSATYTVCPVPTSVKFYIGEQEVTGTTKLVASGTKVTLGGSTSAVTDAEGNPEVPEIYYSTTATGNLTEADCTEENKYTAGTAIEITGKTTIYAIAKGVNGVSPASSITFTVPVVALTELPVENDVIVISNRKTTKDNVTSTVVMGTRDKGGAYGYVNAVIDSTLAGFASTDDMMRLTVKKNKAGQYLFITDGKYLTTTAKQNLTLESSPSIYSLWTITKGDAGIFYIDNANLYLNGTQMSLEYYSSKFTSYTKKTSDEYQFYFWKDTSAVADKTVPPDSVNTLADVTFSGDTNGSVVAGLYIYAECDSYGADFYYSTSAEVTSGNYTSATKANGGEIIIPTDAVGNVTVYALAVLGTGDNAMFSNPVTRTFTVTEDTNTYLTKVDSIAAGDVVSIFYPEDRNTLGNAASDTGLAGSATTMSEKGLVKTDVLVEWTVAKEGDNFVFVNGGKFLTATSDGSLTLDAYSKYALWSLENVPDSDTKKIKSVYSVNGTKNRYLEYYDGVYKIYTITGSETLYEFNFYKEAGATGENVTIPLLDVEFSADGAVNTGTEIELSTATSGAEIYWQFIASGAETATMTAENYATEGTKYAEGSVPEITAAGTLYAIAVKDGLTSSITSAEYTVVVMDKIDFSTAPTTYKVWLDSDKTIESKVTSNSATAENNISVISADNLDIVFSTTASTHPVYSTTAFRVYNPSTLKFIPAVGKIIKKIEVVMIANTAAGISSTDIGEVKSTTEWNGTATNSAPVSLTFGKSFITSIIITYAD